MKRTRLTESDLHRIVRESVKRILREGNYQLDTFDLDLRDKSRMGYDSNLWYFKRKLKGLGCVSVSDINAGQRYGTQEITLGIPRNCENYNNIIRYMGERGWKGEVSSNDGNVIYLVFTRGVNSSHLF